VCCTDDGTENYDAAVMRTDLDIVDLLRRIGHGSHLAVLGIHATINRAVISIHSYCEANASLLGVAADRLGPLTDHRQCGKGPERLQWRGAQEAVCSN
jgi:hypothetical protein